MGDMGVGTTSKGANRFIIFSRLDFKVFTLKSIGGRPARDLPSSSASSPKFSDMDGHNHSGTSAFM